MSPLDDDPFGGPDDRDAPIERPRWIYVGAVLCLVASVLLIVLTIS